MDLSRRGFLKGVAAGIAFVSVPSIALANNVVDTLGRNISRFKDFTVDFDSKTIHYLGTSDTTAREIYSQLKDMWVFDEKASRYEFPMQGIHPEYFVMEDYNLSSQSLGSISSGCIEQENGLYMSCIGLGVPQSGNDFVVLQNGSQLQTEVVRSASHLVKIDSKIKTLSWSNPKTGFSLDSTELGFSDIRTHRGNVFLPLIGNHN